MVLDWLSHIVPPAKAAGNGCSYIKIRSSGKINCKKQFNDSTIQQFNKSPRPSRETPTACTLSGFHIFNWHHSSQGVAHVLLLAPTLGLFIGKLLILSER